MVIYIVIAALLLSTISAFILSIINETLN
ncbi:hypothetical protein M3N64_08015 [Sporolactobacillus sp. CPB3-1]|uniref:Holin-like toxin n=1 Tax=Sporolactobacillus mangiferae TaxID=2940498 RepID=A0ABT0MAK7_9BACL|nr:hypothetical protein [Sporolactobacillus mangiferae]